eukprot:CAMPEP_0171218930 /NCGR_PEP_ID=MMETSP0790-20130122/33455_1 /TAXON_ID=2925 /ORGANISM="Alexandrium catenella, Strain OF101" /LENGTH=149 /DNA_ID=CAMNT_0011684767 /DNA_START=16 /DNA_END=465 /DNA_ORIENTATION=-
MCSLRRGPGSRQRAQHPAQRAHGVVARDALQQCVGLAPGVSLELRPIPPRAQSCRERCSGVLDVGRVGAALLLHEAALAVSRVVLPVVCHHRTHLAVKAGLLTSQGTVHASSAQAHKLSEGHGDEEGEGREEAAHLHCGARETADGALR